MERVPGIEPGYPAWKAGVLPLNYTRILERKTGLEPATFTLARWHSTIESLPHIFTITIFYKFKNFYIKNPINTVSQKYDIFTLYK